MRKYCFSFVFLLCFSILGPNALGAAVLQIQGKITSFDKNEVSVETAKSIYRIDRNALPKEVSNQITRSEVEISLSAPMSAIKDVKSRSKK
jgi:hypothetical protein